MGPASSRQCFLMGCLVTSSVGSLVPFRPTGKGTVAGVPLLEMWANRSFLDLILLPNCVTGSFNGCGLRKKAVENG